MTIYISLSMLKFFSGILNEAVIILVLTYGSIFHRTAAQTALKLRRTSLQYDTVRITVSRTAPIPQEREKYRTISPKSNRGRETPDISCKHGIKYYDYGES